MASLVYFKFKANVKTDSINFDGSAISVKDLKNAIRTKCCLHSTDIDLKLEDDTGREYTKETELIPKYTKIVVRRVPKLNDQKRKSNNADVGRRDISKVASASELSGPNINLAESDLPEDEKIRIMFARSPDIYSEKNYVVKAKPYGIPPAGYICHKCNLSGHWIHNCPGIRDKNGRLIDSKSIKRPTGIPSDFLLEVDADTPGAYLEKGGRYMVPIKDAEAYSMEKKEKRAFTVEENPPYVPPTQRRPPEQFICPLCKELLRDAVLVSCCGVTFCNDCIMGHVFDSDVLGSHKCPNCKMPLTDHEKNVVKNDTLRSIIFDWLRSVSVDAPVYGVPVEKNQNIPPTEPERVVRRVLKPKQPALLERTKPGSHGVEAINQEQNTSSPKSEQPNLKPSSAQQSDLHPDQVGPRNVPFPPKSQHSSVNPVKNISNDTKTLPIVSNTSTNVANMPCATLIGARGTPGVSVPISSSNFTFSRGSAPVLPGIISGENTALVSAMYGSNLVGMTPANSSSTLPQVAGVYPNVPIVPSGMLWHSGEIPYLNGVDQSSLINPNSVFSSASELVPSLLDIHSRPGDDIMRGGKLLSKEEFYQLKMQLMQQSRHKRQAYSRNADSSRASQRRSSGRDRRCDDRIEFHREGRYRRRDSSREFSDRQDSHSRRYNRMRSRSQSIEDYDTWRRRKNRRQLVDREPTRQDYAHRAHALIPRVSPAEDRDTVSRFRSKNRSNESPNSASDHQSPNASHRQQSPFKVSGLGDSERGLSSCDLKLRSQCVNPERSRSQTRDSSGTLAIPCYAASDTASSRGPTPQPVNLPIASHGLMRSSDDLVKRIDRNSGDVIGYDSSSPREDEFGELGAKALRKLKKEKKRKRRHEKKRAKKAARALRESVGLACDDRDGCPFEVVVDDIVDPVVKHRKRKHKKRYDGSEGSHKHKKSKKQESSPHELVEFC